MKKIILYTGNYLNYLVFGELSVIVSIYLFECFNAPWSFGHSIKFNLEDQCCIGWNLAFSYRNKF